MARTSGDLEGVCGCHQGEDLIVDNSVDTADGHGGRYAEQAREDHAAIAAGHPQPSPALLNQCPPVHRQALRMTPTQRQRVERTDAVLVAIVALVVAAMPIIPGACT